MQNCLCVCASQWTPNKWDKICCIYFLLAAPSTRCAETIIIILPSPGFVVVVDDVFNLFCAVLLQLHWAKPTCGTRVWGWHYLSVKTIHDVIWSSYDFQHLDNRKYSWLIFLLLLCGFPLFFSHSVCFSQSHHIPGWDSGNCQPWIPAGALPEGLPAVIMHPQQTNTVDAVQTYNQ